MADVIAECSLCKRPVRGPKPIKLGEWKFHLTCYKVVFTPPSTIYGTNYLVAGR